MSETPPPYAVDISRAWRKLDPANYYDPGEVVILRKYFRLAGRRGDPEIASLYAPEQDAEQIDDATELRGGPIRLCKVDSSLEAVNDVSHAVARLCLSSVQDRLPQWGYFTKDDREVVTRHAFDAPDRTLTPLNPQRLVCINWADSGPGFS